MMIDKWPNFMSKSSTKEPKEGIDMPMEYYHGDEPLIEAQRREDEEAWYNAHCDDE